MSTRKRRLFDLALANRKLVINEMKIQELNARRARLETEVELAKLRVRKRPR